MAEGLTRKQFLQLPAAGLFSATPSPQIIRGRYRPRKWNVLLIMTDQHRPQSMGVHGDKVARTPALDEFAKTAVDFRRAYCADPVCVPSRASMLTGLYAHRHGTVSNGHIWPVDRRTLAHWFSRAGYFTGLIGKMHFVDAQTHGFDYRLGFNDWFLYLGPKTKLYAEEVGGSNSGAGMPQIPALWEDGDPWEGVRRLDGRKGRVAVGRPSELDENDHFENFVARETIRFLKQYGTKHRFFLIASLLKPHDPFMPARRFAEMFPAEKMQLPHSWGRVDLAKVPKYVANRIRRNPSTPELSDPQMAKQRIAMYYGSLAHADSCIGQILQALKELGLENDTLVIYTSDHGEMLGEHGLWGKTLFYEPSVGVPFLIRIPGVTAAGAQCRTPINLVELAATLGELCGVDVDSDLDGESFARSVFEPEKTVNRAVYSEHRVGTPNQMSMIIEGQWKYCQYKSDMPELYNLRDDPDEMNNLALHSDYRPVVDELRAKLRQWHPDSVES